jgi:hypothetical protein
MIQSASTDEFEETLSGLDSRPSPAPERPRAGEGDEILPPPIAELARGIEPAAAREFLHSLFVEIFQLLGLVERVRSAVEGGQALDDVARIFKGLKKSSHYLLTNVEMAELRVEGLSAAFVEALEAAGFALRHELKRVFQRDFGGAGGTQDKLRREALRDCALLENCFQQLAIGLARSFDTDVSGTTLFENCRERREQSVELCAELNGLLDEVRSLERGFNLFLALALVNRVRGFRRERLHHLMYRDWEDFERIAEELEETYSDHDAMKKLLNRMSCYYEALLKQVEMRAVLREGPHA